MVLQLERIPIQEKSVLRRLMELYLYDFSEYDNADVNEHGLYEYDYIDPYWTEDSRHPFFIRMEGKLAGFALVRDYEFEGKPIHSLAEFFVMRKYRRQKVGSHAAQQLFDLFPGLWHVAQEAGNQPAQVFWRKVIGEYTAGNFREITTPGWHGPVQEFQVPSDQPLPKPAPPTTTHSLIWKKNAGSSLEYFSLQERVYPILEGSLILLLDDRPAQVSYHLKCAPDWSTCTVAIKLNMQEGERKLYLEHDGQGNWEVNGRKQAGLAGCLDIDLSITPSTNTLPIRRLNLQPGQSREAVAAWVHFPNLAVQPLQQRYTRLDGQRYRYESLESGYTAELKVDQNGLVETYADIWSRVTS